jgi:hypothetical protein
VQVRYTTLAALTLIAALTSACGIAFSRDEGNDFFLSLDVTGEKVAGAPLTAGVAYETFYPVPVEIVCELRQSSDLVGQIGVAEALAIPGDLTPDDERVPGNFSFDFTVEEPGEFKVECYTRLDEANFIVEEFTIE